MEITPCIFFSSIGGESLAVAQNTYAVKWFQGRELNMVFGLQLSFSRVVCIRKSFDHQTIFGFIVLVKLSYLQTRDSFQLQKKMTVLDQYLSDVFFGKKNSNSFFAQCNVIFTNYEITKLTLHFK